MEEYLSLCGFEGPYRFNLTFWHFDDAVLAADNINHSFGSPCLVNLLVANTGKKVAGKHGFLLYGVLFEAFVLLCKHG